MERNTCLSITLKKGNVMKDFYKIEQSPVHKKYLIKINFDNLKEPIYTNGSYSVMPARTLGISYAKYLKYCRDNYGATIVGKGEKYPIALFNSEAKAKKLLALLNSRMEMVQR